VDTNSLEDSWKVKRDYTLLKNKIDEYLNTRSFNKDDLLLSWNFNNNEYHSYADVLFIMK
jgi:flagellin-like hook-associated protein FlgL